VNRNKFLRQIFIPGLCACSASELLPRNKAMAADGQKAPPDDWRIGFSKTRYADLMEILQAKLDENEFEAVIQALGRKCSGHVGFIKNYRGDLDGYLKELKRRLNEDASVDPETGMITVASQERTECFCPLIDTEAVSDGVCNCSLGWQKQTFETILGKNVDVKIKESVIRGGKRCIFEIKIVQQE
jgi:predicted ArsR family transcriptional regulator